jgi:hypothetical protein
VAFVIVSCGLAVSGYALTPSGTQIKGSCTVNYNNSAGVGMPAVTSNTVVVTVAQVGGVQLTPAARTTAIQPGSKGYVPVTVKNVGNGPDTFVLTPAGVTSWSPKMVVDSNGDGIHQSTETTVVTTTPSVAAGASYKCFLAVAVPTATTGSGSFALASTSSVDSTKKTQGTYMLGPLAMTVSSVMVTPPMVASGDMLQVQVSPAANTSFNKVMAGGVQLVQSGGVWSGNVTASGALGAHPITVTATDAAGNSANDSIGSYKTAPIVVANVKSAHDPIMNALSGKYLFRFCGRVESADAASLNIDDGSGATVKVNAPGYSGIRPGDFITARGILTPSSSLPVMSSPISMVTKL